VLPQRAAELGVPNGDEHDRRHA